MVDTYMAKGFTYFDTAYPYHQGVSEVAVRKAVVERYPREAFVLADKMPTFFVTKNEDYQRIFDEQLERCGVEYFDYYLLHNLGKRTYADSESLGGFEYIAKLKQEGRAKQVGFSFHDDALLLDEILTKHPEVDFVQIQINYLDWNSNSIQSRKCYETLRKHGKPIIVMEPIKGGVLANLPPAAAGLLREHDPNTTAASLALRFTASLDGVTMVLSGMSNFAQMKENTETFSHSETISASERDLLDRIVEALHASIAIPCTACQYCVEDCPKQINIPSMFAIYNSYTIDPKNFSSQLYYDRAIFGRGKASDCIGCKKCEHHCPQHIEITKHLKVIGDQFEKTPSGR